MNVPVSPPLHISIVERDETALDAVSLMAFRLGARVSVYVDAPSAQAEIRSARPSVLLVEPRNLGCNLEEFVASVHAEGDSMRVVLMTTLSADELRANCLPICWDALLQKPFTYSRFEYILRPLLSRRTLL